MASRDAYFMEGEDDLPATLFGLPVVVRPHHDVEEEDGRNGWFLWLDGGLTS